MPQAEAGDVDGERNMADDPFVKPEVPEAIRDLMKMSIEQGEARLSDLRCDEREGLARNRHAPESNR